MEDTDKGYRMHAFICTHQRPKGSLKGCCMDKNSINLMRELKNAARNAGIDDVRVQKSGCLDYCEFGPTCVIYPQGKWFCVTKEAIQPLVDYLGGGKVPSDFFLELKVLQDE